MCIVIPHCDRFVYLMNNEKVEIIEAVMDYLSNATGTGH